MRVFTFVISTLFLLIFISISKSHNSDDIKIKNLEDYPAPSSGCLAQGCHHGIEPIRQFNSKMAQAIFDVGSKSGDPNGCIVCHRGNPKEMKNKSKAHKNLIIHPSSTWVNEKTCGQCHKDYVYSMNRNLMQTEAGKIQGALWGWGAKYEGYNVLYGNYNIKDSDGSIPIYGTKEYKNYMAKMIKKYPQNFPDSLKMLPEVNLKTINQKPEQAVLTYIREDCQRCHIGVKGKKRRGDYRGMGCSACHIPYSDEGFYEGYDKTIPKNIRGKMLVHSIQSSRKTKVKVNGIEYSGIPSETCVSCHNRGKRIGVSYLGIIESPYPTPFTKSGGGQLKMHGKNYIYIQEDVHHSIESRKGNPKGGMLCQDCHTSLDVHGNGNIDGTTYGAVEIECADCHGTPQKYPWELPLGYGDEFGINFYKKPRGVADKPLKITEKFGTLFNREDGYILTARGNPFGDVVKKGNDVIVHSASGLDFKVPLLKTINQNDSWINPQKAKPAMVRIKNHIDKMECYACHSTWAAQCYGCHVKVDYSKGAKSMDWIKSGNSHFENGETSESSLNAKGLMQAGKHTESRSYIRWEDPILGINGEGRVTPLIPGCQQITTVIGPKGKTLVYNKIWRTPPNMENGGKQGQLGIDVTPAQPHTTTRQARECTSCHTNPKALGYGINDGKYLKGYNKNRYMDLKTADGRLLSKNSRPQMERIENLPMDLSQIVTREGKQVQTVGHHWSLSGPLTKFQRDKMERAGVCIACHQDIPDGNIQISTISLIGKFLGLTPHSDKEHSRLLNLDLNFTAIIELISPLLILFILILIFVKVRKRNQL